MKQPEYLVYVSVNSSVLDSVYNALRGLGLKPRFSVKAEKDMPEPPTAPAVTHQQGGIIFPSEDEVRIQRVPYRKKKKFTYAGGIRDKGIKSTDLALQTLTSAPLRKWNMEELQVVFARRGFSRTSTQPALSQLFGLGLVKRDTKGNWFSADYLGG